MHTETDKQIEALIAERKRLELSLEASMVTTPAEAQLVSDKVSRITEINLQIMKLQGKKAYQPRTDATAEAVKSLLQDGRNADAKRRALAGIEGIEETTVWTTKDGKTWDKLEDAIEHQRRGKVIEAIYDADGFRSEWLAIHAEQIADNAAELFVILEPFFRKGE